MGKTYLVRKINIHIASPKRPSQTIHLY